MLSQGYYLNGAGCKEYMLLDVLWISNVLSEHSGRSFLTRYIETFNYSRFEIHKLFKTSRQS